MSLTLRWVGEPDFDRVAQTRMLSYASAPKHLESFREKLDALPFGASDYLLAEENGQAVGTTTAHSFTAWVRSSPVSCQGVAYVGTIRTHRRGRSGVGSRLLKETLSLARKRGQVLSALMPFRASFYEHFGYGVVERRAVWTVPLSVLPTGPTDGLRLLRPDDRTAVADCHQRAVQRGQCDMERPAARWQYLATQFGNDGFEIVDRPDDQGPVRGHFFYDEFQEAGKTNLGVIINSADDLEAFQRQLHFFAALRDQYHGLAITLQADFPLNRLLRESQVPHRPVIHPTASMAFHTRMQVRVLDHLRLLGGMNIPAGPGGKAVVAVHECEGQVSKFSMEFADGRIIAAPTEAAADAECADTTWAAVALGDLSADQARGLGLLQCRHDRDAALLQCFTPARPRFVANISNFLPPGSSSFRNKQPPLAARRGAKGREND